MYGPEILDLFKLLGPFSLGATAESWAQDGCRRDRFPRYPYPVIPAGVGVTSPT